LLRLGVVSEVVPDVDVVTRAAELADRISNYPVAGRVAMTSMWKQLRGEIEEPDAWFRELLVR
jgi:enoyl-CoA hydratase/carnithine racemase